MSNTNEKQDDTEERAKLSLDLGDLESKAVNGPEPEKIEELSQASGFTSRAESKQVSTKTTAPKPKPRKRRKTGRTYPFNTKIKPEAYELLGSLADHLSENEGRPVSMAEVLERSLDLMQNQLKQ